MDGFSFIDVVEKIKNLGHSAGFVAKDAAVILIG